MALDRERIRLLVCYITQGQKNYSLSTPRWNSGLKKYVKICLGLVDFNIQLLFQFPQKPGSKVPQWFHGVTVITPAYTSAFYTEGLGCEPQRSTSCWGRSAANTTIYVCIMYQMHCLLDVLSLLLLYGKEISSEPVVWSSPCSSPQSLVLDPERGNLILFLPCLICVVMTIKNLVSLRP